MINPFGIISTVVLFKFFDKYKNFPLIKPFPPLLVTGICLILILKNFDIDYKTYNETASWLTFLLIPATISLGYPLYKNLNILVKHGVFCCGATGVVVDIFNWKILPYEVGNYSFNVAKISYSTNCGRNFKKFAWCTGVDGLLCSFDGDFWGFNRT